MPESTDKNLLDVSQIFQTFLAFSGDVGKTSVALNIDVDTIQNLAASENWAAKISEWTKLREGDPRDVQVQVNRAVNYVQAHRMRSVIDKIISHLSGKSAEEVIDMLTTQGKHGSSFSSRPLTDLVKAAEACQLMTQRALGDTVAERPETPTEGKGSRVALLVMNAMNAADNMGLDSVAVVRKELQAPTTVLKSAA
jgi:hypothetical protein